MRNKMTITSSNDTMRALFAGEIDNTNVASYKEKLIRAVNSEPIDKLILDFSEVTFIDSAGLGLILGRLNQLQEVGAKLEITNVSSYVLKLLSMVGLAKYVTKIKELVYE